jgi:hypothetical protein
VKMPPGRVFGVQVGALLSVQRLGRVDTQGVRVFSPWKTKLADWGRLSSDLPFPLLAMIFTMADDVAYYGWLREPNVPRSGAPTLQTSRVETLSRWSPKTLDHLLEQVRAWYDAQERPDAGGHK